jgi:hypothetical protein
MRPENIEEQSVRFTCEEIDRSNGRARRGPSSPMGEDEDGSGWAV